MIVPNSEHSSVTGLPEILETIAVFATSVAMGHTEDDRPKFSYTHDNTTGELSVRIPEGQKLSKVVFHHAQTLQTKRRDFRWIFLSGNTTEPCRLPYIPLPKPVDGGNCAQPIYWHKQTLYESSKEKGLYTAMPP